MGSAGGTVFFRTVRGRCTDKVTMGRALEKLETNSCRILENRKPQVQKPRGGSVFRIFEERQTESCG